MPRPSQGDAPAWVERIAAPRRRDPDRQPPLLVLLHGIGADENDLFSLADDLDPRLLIVSVRAPNDYPVGYAWFSIDFRPDGRLEPDVPQAHAALDDLVRWLRAVPARHGADPARMYLLGFSQGAMMTLGVLRRAPALLAGAIALSGRSPDGLFPARAAAAAIAGVPLLVAHGTQDDVLPVENGRRARDAFAPLSLDFTYREYPVGHGISGQEVAFVNTWLAERIDRRDTEAGRPAAAPFEVD